ncbi:hypothetical protein [Paenibacillus solani]|uniref:hypothetical protein n=1 Tax=Paenibacillus solani TaxID=1705565 RepID=UPI003D2CCB0B
MKGYIFIGFLAGGSAACGSAGGKCCLGALLGVPYGSAAWERQDLERECRAAECAC